MIEVRHISRHPVYGEYEWTDYQYDAEDLLFHERVLDEVARRKALELDPIFANEEEEEFFWEGQQLPEPSTPFL
jgi:hypothetical protein